MPRVLVSDSLSEQGLAILRQGEGLEIDYRPGLSEGDLAAAIQGAAALVIRSGSKVTARVLEQATDLRVIGRAGIGVDNVDVAAASKRGIVVMNTPTGNAVTTAEHAIALLLSLARHIPLASQTLKAGKWEKKKLEGRELAGKTLGVIGLGNIGRIVADRGRGLRMNVIGYDPVLTAERAASLGIELVGLDAIWQRADAITVHTPLTAETKGLVNDDVVGKLKKGVLLVNAARGGIYDEAALLRGLESGKIGGVALDVFVTEPPPPDMPLLQHERCVVTPHLGASTKEAQDRVALEIAQQVVAFLATGATQNAVNVPSVTSEVAAKISPYVDLASRLGSFLAQVEAAPAGAGAESAKAPEGQGPRSIEIECVGEPAELGMTAIAASALAGFLKRYLETPVNQVSAPLIAADRGIAVRQLRTAAPRGKYSSLVVLRLGSADGTTRVVEGTLGSDGSARLVKWGDFEIEAQLGGPTLVVINRDIPGVIGFLGTALGNAHVNIARVHLGVAGASGAISVWNLDSDVPAAVLGEIRRSSNVSRALLIHV
jgi:(S)-sulfolactate dehydrogenase